MDELNIFAVVLHAVDMMQDIDKETLAVELDMTEDEVYEIFSRASELARQVEK